MLKNGRMRRVSVGERKRVVRDRLGVYFGVMESVCGGGGIG